jgi:luciferase-like monooxygenase
MSASSSTASRHEARLLPSDAVSRDLAEAAKHRSPWVVLPNCLYYPVKGAEEYAGRLDALVYAEELGFDAIGVNEHHQTAYGLMPAPNLIASALIQRTETIKIAILARALPSVNNPIYTAEEFATLDNLSKGRIIAGFVGAIGSEYHSSRTNPYFSHERVCIPSFKPPKSSDRKQVTRRFGTKPDKNIVDRQAASPSSWKTPFIATRMAW